MMLIQASYSFLQPHPPFTWSVHCHNIVELNRRVHILSYPAHHQEDVVTPENIELSYLVTYTKEVTL